MTVTENFIKIVCITVDMLFWLITNPFVASVLTLVIADLREAFTYKLEGCFRYLMFQVYLFVCNYILYTFNFSCRF